MTLPLPLTPFEEYVITENSPSFPMNMFCRMRFRGKIDYKTYVQAAHNVMARHPLLQAKLEKTAAGKLQWVAAEEPGAVPLIQEEPTRGYPAVQPIDITKEIGFRPHVVQGRDNFDLFFQVHHAAADGLGAFILGRDSLIEYARLKGIGSERATRSSRLEPELLAGRGNFHVTNWELLKMSPQLSVGLFGIAQYFFRWPFRIAKGEIASVSDPAPDPFPTGHTMELSIDDSTTLAEVAVELGCTVNDLMARDIFIALQRWREKHNPGKPHDWLRLMTPANMRTYADRRLPAANVVSMLFFDRRARDTEDPKKLLESFRFEMDIIRKFNLEHIFVLMLRALRKIPGGLKWLTKPKCAKTTAVFTNLGEPMSRIKLPRNGKNLLVGDIEMIGMDLLAPFRPHTAAAFAAFKYGGMQGLSLHFDHRNMSSDEAQELLDTVEECLGETIEQRR